MSVFVCDSVYKIFCGDLFSLLLPGLNVSKNYYAFLQRLQYLLKTSSKNSGTEFFEAFVYMYITVSVFCAYIKRNVYMCMCNCVCNRVGVSVFLLKAQNYLKLYLQDYY